MSDDYIYAVARIRSRELSLFTRQDLEQLMAARTYEECVRTLQDKGWGDGSSSSQELLRAEEEKTWAFIRELTQDLTPFEVLLLPAEYNNLKAAVKSVLTDVEAHEVFLPDTAIPPEELMRAVREQDFSALPASMADSAKEASRLLLETGDGQLCDILLDRACLLDILEKGRESKDPLLAQYAELTVAAADIKIAARSAKTRKSRAFLEEALAPCSTLDQDALISAACKDTEALYSYLSSTQYEEAVSLLKKSYSAFEKWCDDKVMELIESQRFNSFTVGPLFAYVIARQREIAVVRIILSGKLNELDDGMIRERLRELYV